MFFHLGASAEAEPVKDDGCSCCYPWVGYHLPCLRRVPASVSARVSSPSLFTLPRVTPHRGCASSDARWKPSVLRGQASEGLLGLGCDRQLFGHGPHEAREFTGNSLGDD